MKLGGWRRVQTFRRPTEGAKTETLWRLTTGGEDGKPSGGQRQRLRPLGGQTADWENLLDLGRATNGGLGADGGSLAAVGDWDLARPPAEEQEPVSVGQAGIGRTTTEEQEQAPSGPPTENYWQVSAWVSAMPAVDTTQQVLGRPLTLELGLQSQFCFRTRPYNPLLIAFLRYEVGRYRQMRGFQVGAKVLSV